MGERRTPDLCFYSVTSGHVISFVANKIACGINNIKPIWDVKSSLENVKRT